MADRKAFSPKSVKKANPMHEGLADEEAQDEAPEESTPRPAKSEKKLAKAKKASKPAAGISYTRGPGGSLIEH